MLLFIFAGFFIGFTLSFRFVQRPRRALIWGGVLGLVPLALMLGPGNAPVQGIGSVLNFAFFALGPMIMLPFFASSIALGVAGGAAVQWAGRGRARWVGGAVGLALVGAVAALTVLPVAQREVANRQTTKDRDARAEAIMQANFKGTLAGHEVTFPASPRLYLSDDCGPGVQAGLWGCSTSSANPVTILTKPDEVLLHERRDQINFRAIGVSTVQPDCNLRDFCLTQDKINHWCSEVRPDQTNSIWCRDTPPMQFVLRREAEATAGPSDRGEPELAARYADTPLGLGRVDCFYHPDPDKTDKQGASCNLRFSLADGVQVVLPVRRALITSGDPALAATIALIPDYWAALTGGR